MENIVLRIFITYIQTSIRMDTTVRCIVAQGEGGGSQQPVHAPANR